MLGWLQAAACALCGSQTLLFLIHLLKYAELRSEKLPRRSFGCRCSVFDVAAAAECFEGERRRTCSQEVTPTGQLGVTSRFHPSLSQQRQAEARSHMLNLV